MFIELVFQDNPRMGIAVVRDGKKNKAQRTEVRGNFSVGTEWTGDRLDRFISALPRTVNISELFAGNGVGVRREDRDAIREWLAKEEKLTNLMVAAISRGFK